MSRRSPSGWRAVGVALGVLLATLLLIELTTTGIVRNALVVLALAAYGLRLHQLNRQARSR